MYKRQVLCFLNCSYGWGIISFSNCCTHVLKYKQYLWKSTLFILLVWNIKYDSHLLISIWLTFVHFKLCKISKLHTQGATQNFREFEECVRTGWSVPSQQLIWFLNQGTSNWDNALFCSVWFCEVMFQWFGSFLFNR